MAFLRLLVHLESPRQRMPKKKNIAHKPPTRFAGVSRAALNNTGHSFPRLVKPANWPEATESDHAAQLLFASCKCTELQLRLASCKWSELYSAAAHGRSHAQVAIYKGAIAMAWFTRIQGASE